MTTDITALPDQLIQEMLKSLFSLEYEDIINFCSTNMQFRQVCNQKYFWHELANSRYPNYKGNTYILDAILPKQAYIEVSTAEGDVMKGSDFFIEGEDALTRAASEGNIDLVRYFLGKGYFTAYAFGVTDDINVKVELVNGVPNDYEDPLGLYLSTLGFMNSYDFEKFSDAFLNKGLVTPADVATEAMWRDYEDLFKHYISLITGEIPDFVYWSPNEPMGNKKYIEILKNYPKQRKD